MKIPRCMCIVAVRPNFVKIAPIIRALKLQNPKIQPILVHTGQHYDENISGTFFDCLDIPHPDENLAVQKKTDVLQIASIMEKFEPVLLKYAPDCVLVVGDVNSSLACSLVASKHHIKIVHIEAGLRSFDRSMPEEINRILIDNLADLHFTTEESAAINLIKEGFSQSSIHFCGNVMIDSLNMVQKKLNNIDIIFKKYNIQCFAKQYAVLTLHRPSNVDSSLILNKLMNIMNKISTCLPIVFPVHPRTKKQLAIYHEINEKPRNIYYLDPLDYIEMSALMKNSKCVFTDSGGIQEETTALGVPCITLRENTERPITVTKGTNCLVGSSEVKIMQAFNSVMQNAPRDNNIPEFWDGHAAIRISNILCKWLYSNFQSTIYEVKLSENT